MPKTGTTSLQHFFKRQYRESLAAGLLYPRAGSSHNGLAHHSWHKTFSGQERAAEDWIAAGDPQAMLAELAAEIQSAKPQRILLSSESFRASSIARLLQEIPHQDATVVLFIRRADQLLEAQYAQGIKTGRHKMAPAQYIDHIKRVQPDWLRPYDLVAGHAALDARLIIQPFERRQLEGGLLNRFLALIGQPGMSTPAVDAFENKRLHPMVTRLIAERSDDKRLLGNKYNAMRTTLNELAWRISDDVATDFFSPAQKLDILDQARGDYVRIEQEFLEEDRPQLFFDPEPGKTGDFKPPQALNPADSADIVLALWDWFWEQKR